MAIAGPEAPIPAEADVVIIGCGPVGALLGNLLGQHGLTVAILEREHTPHGEPRAFSCDDEALRIYQAAGLLDRLLADFVQCPAAEFVGADGRLFATLRFAGLDFGAGHHALNFFHQPALEHALREGLRRFPRVSLHLGQQVTDLWQDSQSLIVTSTATGSGRSHKLRARFALGCDGRRSTARTLAGIAMSGSRYQEPWLAISGTAPAPPSTMPTCRFVCDPQRPGFVARGALQQCRWEFMLRPEDELDADRQPSPALISRLLGPYLQPAQVAIERASIYTFEDKVAAAFRDRRLFLVGDAAHTMPPMMGQGLTSGLRDAANLAWKLALVLGGTAGDRLLDTYEQERRPHVRAMSQVSVRIGQLFMMRNARLAALRDRGFRLADRIARVHRFVTNVEFKPPPIYAAGALFGGRHRRGEPQGTLFPQPPVVTASGQRLPLDDALGSGFCVLALSESSRALLQLAAGATADPLQLRSFAVRPPGTTACTAEELIDAEGQLTAWFHRYRVEVVLLRPDRFVFGALPATEAHQLVPALLTALRG